MDILIVEDDRAVRLALRRGLERAGFMVDIAENGLAAFAEIQRKQYRAILCDVNMPFLKGNNLYTELEQHYPDVARRVVFITGGSSRQDIADFLQRSGRPVLGKPVEMKQLVATIRRVAEQP